MPRQLKTYITNLGFFEMAIAAPSMKAALEAWGMSHNAFQHGFAKQSDDAKIIAATLDKPGVVLKRPVGTTGAFSENAELPKELWKGTLPKIEPPKKKAKGGPKKLKPKAAPKRAENGKQDKAAILSFEKAKERREREREKEEEREAARQGKEQARIERALAKADQALEEASARHDDVIAAIEKEREKLDRRADMENERWEKERHKLEEARERATE